MSTSRDHPSVLHYALDTARYGAALTLDFHEHLPSTAAAARLPATASREALFLAAIEGAILEYEEAVR